ncbi:dihydrolipoyllysine-residue acetyltransferase component of pyruvate dehydrogenase complex, mitochondrial [Filimonas sp.]|nr:dihydrolipoyllysine-residue acetyltransferase component of pyruvate dehydrogenase complex, mitochondrial [Filimonas sp.]
MADVIRMPLLSDTMTEGKIAVWNKKIGDKVKSDDSIADVETDKATMEVIPYVDGTLLYIGVEAGQTAKVNEIIAIIGKEGEDISSLIHSDKQSPKEEAPKSASPDIVPPTSNIAPAASDIVIPKDLTVIRMPLLSDTMTEGKIVVWNKNIGDKVKADDSLADVETDKATMEVIGYADGTLLYKGVEAGQAAKVNAVIAVVGKEGTDITPYLPALQSDGTSPAAAQETPATPVAAATAPPPANTQPVTTTPQVSSDSRLKASPLAKSIAKEKGIDLHNVQGTGDNGRIVKRDLDNVSAEAPIATKQAVATVSSFVPGAEGHTDTPVTQMRKIIAQKLSDSKFTAPHFYLKTSVAMDSLMEIRKQINTLNPVKISVNDMMIKAVALSLTKHPDVNSSWMGDFIRQNHHIHIGSAIALPEGLIVPVIKFANQKSLSQIATDAAELYEKARNKKIVPSEFTGNTFTISNLGMMDIDEFTAIINPPDACILAVGKITQTPVVENGAVVIKGILKLTLSCDHRVVDGAVGANFLQTLKGYLENPISMLV